ncbi:MAG: MATE family efflux transporter [Erysipelotrichaceae bacterium]|nr:MATE family efflux transporter [Erysipelotrichaceae bacterium]
MQHNDQLYLYSTEKIGKAIVLLAIPSVLSSLINLIYNLINSIFVGMLKNTAMIAAITVSTPLTTVIHAFGSALGVGASSFLSRQLGANELENSKETVKTAITSGILVSILIIILSTFCLRPLLSLLTDDPAVLEYAYVYSAIIFYSSIAINLKQIIINLLKTEADILFPMFVLLGSVLINIIFAPFFMFDWGLNLGISGAALATMLADLVSLVALLWRLCCKTKYVRWRFGSFGFKLSAFKEIINVGSAVFVRNALPSFSTAIFASSAGMFGTAFVAGVGIGKKASSLALFAIQGMASGFLPFAAYNYGAQNKQRLRKSSLMLISGMTIFAIVMTIVFQFYTEPICSLYASDPQVILYGSQMLRFFNISLVTQGAYNVLLVMLQAFGRNKDSMMVSLARGVFFYIPIVYFLPRLYGSLGIYLSQPITDWLTLFVILYISRHIIKHLLFDK